MLTLDAEVLLWAGRGRAGLSALVISRTARTRPFVGWSVSRKGFRTSPGPQVLTRQRLPESESALARLTR
jgi:hypothetical protein